VLRVCVVCVLRAPSLIARAGFAALSRTPSLAPPRPPKIFPSHLPPSLSLSLKQN
jgi:hypothetical protein